MATYDSAECLSRLRTEIRMPSGTDFPTDAQCYLWLAQGQVDVYTRLATFCPKALISVPTQMSTADSGYTYTFGIDASSNNEYPIGSVVIYRTRNDIPDWPMIEGVDYLMEGDRIRLPDYSPFSGTAPYYQGITVPLTLDASTAPALKPVMARELIVDAAAIRYAEDAGVDSARFQRRFEASWGRWIGALQTQYARPGEIAASHPFVLPPRAKYYRGFFGYRGIR